MAAARRITAEEIRAGIKQALTLPDLPEDTSRVWPS